MLSAASIGSNNQKGKFFPFFNEEAEIQEGQDRPKGFKEREEMSDEYIMTKERSMESSAARIENLLNEKILLFQDLVEVLKDEKKSIVEIDVDKLWAFSQKKQTIASAIEAIIHQIIGVLDEAAIDHAMNVKTFSVGKMIEKMEPEKTDRLGKQHISLILIKKRVHALASENKKFITEYLGVMDELIGMISNIGDHTPVYDNNRFNKRSKKTTYMLNTEV